MKSLWKLMSGNALDDSCDLSDSLLDEGVNANFGVYEFSVGNNVLVDNKGHPKKIQPQIDCPDVVDEKSVSSVSEDEHSKQKKKYRRVRSYSLDSDSVSNGSVDGRKNQKACDINLHVAKSTNDSNTPGKRKSRFRFDS